MSSEEDDQDKKRRNVEEHKEEQQPVIETEMATEEAIQVEVIELGHNKESKQEAVSVTVEPQDPPTEEELQEKQEAEKEQPLEDSLTNRVF